MLAISEQRHSFKEGGQSCLIWAEHTASFPMRVAITFAINIQVHVDTYSHTHTQTHTNSPLLHPIFADNLNCGEFPG